MVSRSSFNRSSRPFCFAIALIASLLAMTVTPSCAASPIERPPEWAAPIETSDNLFRVTPSFYRSAQLEDKDLSMIEKLGIKTVVNLRTLHTDKFILQKTGIRAIRIPVLPFEVTDNQMVKILRTIHNAERSGPVLLHCQFGADRTGTVTAMYRIVFQGWTREQALDEFEHGGYGYHEFLELFPEYIKKVDIDALRKRIGTT